METKILIADDERMTRRMLEAILTGAGYSVITAEDGQTAVELAASECPDLVIIDGLLPKLHGFLACKAIKELDHSPTVIILTGVYTKPTYRCEVKNQYNADEILKKPVRGDELLVCIQKHLAALRNLAPTVADDEPYKFRLPEAAAIAAQPNIQPGFTFVEQH